MRQPTMPVLTEKWALSAIVKWNGTGGSLPMILAEKTKWAPARDCSRETSRHLQATAAEASRNSERNRRASRRSGKELITDHLSEQLLRRLSPLARLHLIELSPDPALRNCQHDERDRIPSG